MIMRIALVLLAAAAFATAEKVSFQNYKVFRVVPKSTDELELLKHLENYNGQYSYWSSPNKVGHAVDIMVSPQSQSDFVNLMSSSNVHYHTYIENVQRLIDTEQPLTREGGFGWKRYHTLDEIYAWLEYLGKQYPGQVRVVDGGRTYQGRPIKGVVLNFGRQTNGTERSTVFIEGGIHAREWISPATVTYIVNQFLTSEQPEVRRLAESYEWHIFPSFNPDGYVNTHNRNRLWRKTLSVNGFCRGADANRNWGYKWMSGGASNNPCSDTFAGRKAFSEIETRSMAEYIDTVGKKLYAYISFHSYSQLLLFPYGHTKAHLDNYDESLSIGKKTIAALARRYGTKYVTGNVAETIYVASGGSMDWVKAKYRVPIVFTYELRDTGDYGFLLPANQIIPNAEEVLDSLLAMFKEARVTIAN
ncbi:hypothetical protein TKK_0001149 [Trichogramma kaykai]